MTTSRILGLALAGFMLLAGSQCRADSESSPNAASSNAASSNAIADSSQSSNSPTSNQPSNSAVASSSKPSASGNSKSSSGPASFPLRLLGVVAGFAVGTPICGIRVPIAEEKYGVDDLTNKSNRKRTHIAAAIFYLPQAVLAGACEAPLWAFNNAVVNYDKPFSKDQFSLGDNEVPPKKQKDDITGTSDR